MNSGKLARRFLVPAALRTLLYWLKYRAFVSPRAEVDFSEHLILGRGVAISAFVKIKATDGPVEIGERATIGPGCFISSGTAGIRIGPNSMVAANSVVVATNHSYRRLDVPIQEQGHQSRGIRIGGDVWIGANSVILDGSEVGDHVIVNAGSVVSGKFAPKKILAGNPAKVIFERR